MEKLLSPFLDDDLSPAERQQVEKHLNQCSSCSQLYAALKETVDALVEMPELDISEDLRQRLYKIEKKRSRSGFRSHLDFFLRPSFQPIMAIIAVVSVLLSIYTFHPGRSQFNKAVERQIHIGYSKISRLISKAESFTDSLKGQKDTILVSLKDINLFGESEE
jgi:anti-sigma factor RsiW